MATNLALPGNPRYQPKDLIPIIGYDNLAKALVEVEIALLYTLGDLHIIKHSLLNLLTPEIERRLLSITMTEIDEIERAITKHDIRALIRLIQSILPQELRRWVHVVFTSFDVIDTARILQFLRIHTEVLMPRSRDLMMCLTDRAKHHAEMVQIGRTHGQHALPITVGFWLATILHRVLYNVKKMEDCADELVGKISGAVGAHNAQVGLVIRVGGGKTFEEMLLARLGLRPAPISTQILPPEPLAYYLNACVMLSAVLGQFGRDGRHLMRTEIDELVEPFDDGQVGSSTMAHKRNPINFENLEGTFLKNKSEHGKVFDALISEHQRDLVGSSLARDFPTIVVNLTHQLDTLLRKDKNGVPFVRRITVNGDALERNLNLQGDRILAEPMYLALQMYGYEGDAHELVNREAVPMIGKGCNSLYEAMGQIALVDSDVAAAWSSIPAHIHEMLQDPKKYIGLAPEKTFHICNLVEDFLE